MDRYRFIPAQSVKGYWTLRGQWSEPNLKMTEEEAALVPVPFYAYSLEAGSEVGFFTDDLDEFTNIIPLPDSFEEICIDPDFRKDLRRVEKKNSDVRLVFDRKEDLDAASGWFLELCPDENEDDFRIRIEDWRNNCSLISAYLEEELIAVHISWETGDTVNYCGCWWNRKYRNMSPATFLLKKDIERAIAAGKRFFDLGVGDEPYKKKWNPVSKPTKYYAKMSAEDAKRMGITKFVPVETSNLDVKAT